MKTTAITTDDALRLIRASGDAYITAKTGEQIARAFGTTLKKLNIQPRTVADMGGFALPGYEDHPSVPCVAVAVELTIALGLQAADGAYSHPYWSRRRNAEGNARRAYLLLERFVTNDVKGDRDRIK